MIKQGFITQIGRFRNGSCYNFLINSEHYYITIGNIRGNCASVLNPDETLTSTIFATHAV